MPQLISKFSLTGLPVKPIVDKNASTPPAYTLNKWMEVVRLKLQLTSAAATRPCGMGPIRNNTGLNGLTLSQQTSYLSFGSCSGIRIISCGEIFSSNDDRRSNKGTVSSVSLSGIKNSSLSLSLLSDELENKLVLCGLINKSLK